MLDLIAHDLHIWINDRKPTTGQEAGRLADDYIHSSHQEFMRPTRHGGNDKLRKCHRCKKIGQFIRDCPQKNPSSAILSSKEKLAQEPMKCYSCSWVGHITMYGSNNVLFFDTGTRVSVLGQGSGEGKGVQDIILDTGCKQTMVCLTDSGTSE